MMKVNKKYLLYGVIGVVAIVLIAGYSIFRPDESTELPFECSRNSDKKECKLAGGIWHEKGERIKQNCPPCPPGESCPAVECSDVILGESYCECP